MFGQNDQQSSFGPPTAQAPLHPGLAAHWAQQAQQHALRQPNNWAAQQAAAAWAAQQASQGPAPAAPPAPPFAQGMAAAPAA